MMALSGNAALRDYWRVEALMPVQVTEGLRQTEIIAGVDEAGRGPLAGPVVAAAVVIPDAHERLIAAHARDSKTLSPGARTDAANLIGKHCTVGVGIVETEQIDALNIFHATMAAMCRALETCGDLDGAVIDGNRCPASGLALAPCVKGDGRFAAIAAASIVAKITRDEIMVAHARTWPEYGFETHKGYGTPAHVEALRRFGPCPLHRQSFKPVRDSALAHRSADSPGEGATV